MPNLTLKQVPVELVEQLRVDAARQRRSLNQQAIYVLEQAYRSRSESFSSALDGFFRSAGPPPGDTAEAFDGLRSHDSGRDVDLS